MATINLIRTRQFINRFRPYKILVNGKLVSPPSYGENKTLTLEPGTYTIRAKLDWIGSEAVEITVEEQETKTLEIGCNMIQTKTQHFLHIIGWVVLLGSIWRYEAITAYTWIILLLLWLLRDVILTNGKSFIYYLTTGRSRYLYIKPLSMVVAP